MSEAITAISTELIKDSPALFFCFLAMLGEFLWFKHSIKIVKDVTDKSIEEIRKAYEDAYQKAIEAFERANKRRR